MGGVADLPSYQARHRGAGSRPHRRPRAGSVMLGLLVTGAVVLAGAVALVPALAGATSFTVPSASMRPALPAGSVAVVRPASASSIRPGDVITFADRTPSPQAIAMHRVVAVRQTPAGPAFVTKADAGNAPDPGLTSAADVRGVLWYHVPWVGTLRATMAGPAALFYLVGALLVLVAAHLTAPGGTTRQRRW